MTKTKVFVAIPVSSGELPPIEPLYPDYSIDVIGLSDYGLIDGSYYIFSLKKWNGNITHWLKETEINILNEEEEAKKYSDIWDECEKWKGWVTESELQIKKETFINSLLKK